MNSTIFSTIVAVLILAGIIGYIYIKKRNDAEGKKELEEFFETLRITFEDYMIKYLDNTDITNFTNLSDAQLEILNDLYDQLWKITINTLTNMQDKTTATIIGKVITRENVEAFIKQVYESDKIQEKFTNKYNTAVVAASKEFNKYETDMTNYTNTFLKEEKEKGLEKVIDTIKNDEELNPQTDEEEVINPKDNSIEFLD